MGMHGDYVDAIIRSYQYEAKTNPRFRRLQRVSLKDHCKAVLDKRFNQRDQVILRNFFGEADGKGGYLRLITNCSADRFRPLVDILQGERNNPKEDFVELLAWIFDVKPRPYNEQFDYKKVAIDFPESAPGNIDDQGSPAPSVKPPPGNYRDLKENGPGKGNRRRKIAALILLMLVAGLTGFVLKSGKKIKYEYGCMYWAEDHFIASPCIKRGGDTAMVILDQDRLQNFRRITDTAKINESSIRKVWYGIKNGVWEFYSMPGKHPLDGKELRRFVKDSYEKFRKSQMR